MINCATPKCLPRQHRWSRNEHQAVAYSYVVPMAWRWYSLHAVSLWVTVIIQLVVGWHYFWPGGQLPSCCRASPPSVQ